MMKGAIAMVCATQYPDDEAGGRGKKSAATAHFPMVAPRRVQEARTVRRFAPEFVDAVIAGTWCARRGTEVRKAATADTASWR
jgi:hypothetical protein